MLTLSQPLFLGSQSPRRKQLLEMAGLDFTVAAADVDETVPPHMHADDVAAYLARLKADALKEYSHKGILITADTVVILEGEILGKPENLDQARAFIGRLAGNTHKVMTGVCIATKGAETVFSDTTHVRFARLTAKEIDYYVAHHPVMDKAGAYGAQDWMGVVGIEHLDGSFYNVMGLPVHRIFQHLKTLP